MITLNSSNATTATTRRGVTFLYTSESKEGMTLISFRGTDAEGEAFHGDLLCWRNIGGAWAAKIRDNRGDKFVIQHSSMHDLIRDFVDIMQD